MLLLALRRMSGSKWMTICLLVGSIMAIAIVSCIPIYTNGILQRMLIKDLENYQTDSSIYPGTYCFKADFQYAYSDEDRAKAYSFFNKKITGDISDNFEIPFLASEREVAIEDLAMSSTDLKGNNVTLYTGLGAIDALDGHIDITNGRMYSKECIDGVYEVIVTSGVMKDFNILLNHEYTVYSDLSQYKNLKYRIKVVGVFTVKDTSDVFWNKKLSQYSKMFLMDYALFDNDFIAENNPLISKAQWFYALDYHKMTIDRIDDILGEYSRQADWLKKYLSTMELSIPAVSILEKYLERSLQLKTTLWLLVIPILIMLVFYIFMVSRLIVMHDENGIAVLKSRGAGKLQIFMSYMIESIIIGAMAMIAGPPLGMALCRVLGASNGFLEFVERSALPLRFENSVWIYSIIAIMLFIITMLIPVFLASRTSIVGYKQNLARKSKTPLWKKFFLDILVLALSGYGIYLYNQQQKIVAETGINASKQQIDPLLFLTSTLFILGAGLLFLRIYPYIIRFIHFLGKRIWTPVMYVSLLQVGRSKGREQFLMLFIILAISSGVYSANSARTINRNIEDKIKYQTSADVTIMAVWEDNQPKAPVGYSSGDPSNSAKSEPLRYYEPDYTKFSNLSGAEKATKVLSVDKAEAQCYDQTVNNIKLMGIIPNEFAKVAWFRNDLLPYHWYQYLNLMTDAPKAFLLSSDLKDRLKVKLGDTIYVSWGEQNYIEGVVYAFIGYWPTYNPNPSAIGKTASGLIVANFNFISNKLAVQPYEVWIKEKDGATDKQINDDIINKKLDVETVTYKNQQLVKAKNDPMLLGINGSLTLSFIATMVISTLGFLIYWILSIQSRALYFGILRAMGLSKAKVIGIIACEQMLVSGASIIMGFVIGRLACNLFIPMLQIVYSSAEQVPPFKIIIEAEDYLKIYSVVAVMLLVGFSMLWRIIARIRIDQAVKMGKIEMKASTNQIIKTEELSRVFRSGGETIHALKNVSIVLEASKLNMLRGRSGSGKTTLINLLGALDSPDSGRIFFNGIDVTNASESYKNKLHRKNIGFVFQSVALISMMSVYENVEFGLRVAGFNSNEWKKRTEECLGMVGLGKRMNHRPHELSGGEQQRVAIARAIAHKPDIVFADKPTAELDTHMGLQVVKLLKSLVKQQGLTVVMTTHDPSMIEIADCVYTLEDGEIVNE